MVSEKQKQILTKNGYTEEAISKMDYKEVSSVIGGILNKPKPETPTQGAPYHKEVIVPVVEKVQDWKPKGKEFDNVSAYTRQATDLCIAMLEANVNSKTELVPIADLMNEAIICVAAAKARLK